MLLKTAELPVMTRPNKARIKQRRFQSQNFPRLDSLESLFTRKQGQQIDNRTPANYMPNAHAHWVIDNKLQSTIGYQLKRAHKYEWSKVKDDNTRVECIMMHQMTMAFDPTLVSSGIIETSIITESMTIDRTLPTCSSRIVQATTRATVPSPCRA